jgi:hypothetical protein
VNPFVAGHRRNLRRRAYRVEVRDLVPPAADSARAPNTLYAQPGGDAPIELLYRVYMPDRGYGLAGGSGLLRPILRNAGGTRLRDRAACAAINDPDRSIPQLTVDENQWFIATHAPGCAPATAPAVNPPRWKRFFNLDYGRLGFALGCTDASQQIHDQLPHDETGGFYSNGDIRYLYAPINRRFQKLLVIEGRAPVVPHTFDHQRRMGRGQLRYWSFCAAESAVTGRTEDCLADRQIPIHSDGTYTVVVGRPKDRPANATFRCGTAWLRWPLRGDAVDNPDFGFLIMRHMLPAPSFGEAIQRITKGGTEKAVMGPYFPRSHYTSKAQFEVQGCRA